MLPKISLPPPTISMRTAIMLLQTQVTATKVVPDPEKSVVVEQSQAAIGLEKLLNYARTAQELATRTMATRPADGDDASTITPDPDPAPARTSLAQQAAAAVTPAPPSASDTSPDAMATAMKNGPGSTGAVLPSDWLTPPVRPSSS